MEVTFLGTSSAIPMHGRSPSSQYLTHRNTNFLIDCGEATQFQLQRFGISPHKIHVIFISHLHGDHYYGLLPLLNTLQLTGRKHSLLIIAPRGISEVITLQLKVSSTILNYPLKVKELEEGYEGCVFENEEIAVCTVPLQHRISCFGFVFKEKNDAVKLRKDFVKTFNPPVSAIKILLSGRDVLDDKGDIVFKFSDAADQIRERKSYAYCSDTLYFPELDRKLAEVSTLYFDCTFMHDKLEKALITHHSTTIQAAELAKTLGVEKLILGHFSGRYKDLTPLKEEAQQVFSDTILAVEGETVKV